MPIAEFQNFGTPHLVAIGLTLVLPFPLAWVARRSASPAAGTVIAWCLAGVLLLNEVAGWSARISDVGLLRFAEHRLPLHVCGIAVFLTAVTLLRRNQATYEIAYFWGLVGAANAVLTPGELDAPYPEFRFFQYFTAHSGIVVGTLFATWGLGMRPTIAGLLRAFAWLNLFAAGIAALNFFVGSNYMYLSAPPSGTVSPFFFAPWPWYILTLEFIALGMFVLVYAPFPLARRWCRQAPALSAARPSADL